MYNNNFSFSSVSSALPHLVTHLWGNGKESESRNGRVQEHLNTQITLTQPVHRYILNRNRKANVFAQIAETMWVLSGRNDIEWLSAYLPRAKNYSDDGETWRGGYGPRIRNWHGIDQLERVVEILRDDPMSRRAVISIYDPSIDIEGGKDVPCNDFLQFQIRGNLLHLTVTVRSNDLMWGWSGINAFEWSTLQEIVASLLDVEVGHLVFNIGNLHLYENHWDKARSIRAVEPMTVDDTRLRFNPDGIITDLSQVDILFQRWFVWEAMCRSGEATIDQLDDWEEPLFKAWAAAIAYYWTQDDQWLWGITRTSLGEAITLTPASLYPEPAQKPSDGPVTPVTGAGPGAGLSDLGKTFYESVIKLHAVKHKSYGDSWKKRGEKMSIIPNIARKVDRLGVGDQYDSEADTVVDLWVYLAKYLVWLQGSETSGPEHVNPLLHRALVEAGDFVPLDNWQQEIPARFNRYVDQIDTLSTWRKREYIWALIQDVTPIAFDLTTTENEYQPNLGVF